MSDNPSMGTIGHCHHSIAGAGRSPDSEPGRPGEPSASRPEGRSYGGCVRMRLTSIAQLICDPRQPDACMIVGRTRPVRLGNSGIGVSPVPLDRRSGVSKSSQKATPIGDPDRWNGDRRDACPTRRRFSVTSFQLQHPGSEQRGQDRSRPTMGTITCGDN